MFRMDTKSKAIQAAMAAEIGARLGRMNRSKAWMHREAGISASAWRHYFTAFDRDVPLSAVQAVARVLHTSTGELITLAEEAAPQYAGEFMGLNAQERREWDRAVFREPEDPSTGGTKGQEGLTGS